MRRDGIWEAFGDLLGGKNGQWAQRYTGALSRFTTPAFLIALTAISAMIAAFMRQPCALLPPGDPQTFSRTCYSDWPVIFSGRGISEGTFPYSGEGAWMEYPVLLSLLAWMIAWITPGAGSSLERIDAYVQINTFLTAMAWAALTLVTMKTASRLRQQGAFSAWASGRPSWGADAERAALVALSPAILVSAYINWDVWAALLASIALWFIVRQRWSLAGLAIGVGTAFKLYPVLLLGIVFLCALRSWKKRELWVNALRTTLVACAAWLAINVPLMLMDYGSWKIFLEFSKDRPSGYSSFWYVYSMLGERAKTLELSTSFMNGASLAAFLFLLGLITLFACRSKRPVPPGALAFLIVASFVLTNKVYSPQFVIWLVPLAVLAGFSWRTLIVWQLVEVLHWWAVWGHLSKMSGVQGPNAGLPESVYALSVVAHMGALIVLMLLLFIRHITEDSWTQGREKRNGLV